MLFALYLFTFKYGLFFSDFFSSWLTDRFCHAMVMQNKDNNLYGLMASLVVGEDFVKYGEKGSSKQ